MDMKMFCFQCEQSAGCRACTGAAGVCGKGAETARLQDELTGALIGLARASAGSEDWLAPETDNLVMEALFATVTNVNFDDASIAALIDRVRAEKRRARAQLRRLRVSLRQNRGLPHGRPLVGG